MHESKIYLRNVCMSGVITDSRNRIGESLPVIPLGMGVELILTIFKNNSGTTTFSASELNFASWEFSINSDFGTPATVKLLKTDGITVNSDGTINILIANTATLELEAYLASDRQKNMICELCGYKTGETVPSFLLQWNTVVRNRIGGSGTGTPSPAEDGTLSAAQIQSLIRALPSAPIITTLDSAAISPVHGRIYRKTAASGDCFTFSSQGLDSSHTVDFEIRVIMPTPVVSVSFNSGITWLEGTTPQLNTPGSETVFHFRWDGTRFIGKKLYSLTE